ncbi:MAG TPA: hypothetical protein VMS63_08680 [Gaiellaceae bacterium]|nr:hypothetical protein [Gaiellaceae bacterium]
MTRIRRHRAGLVALSFAAVAAVLLLLAVDARSWRTTVARDDIRFRALPAHGKLWRPSTILPGDPAGALIGTGDTLAYRRGLQLFWFSRIGADPETRLDLPTLRAKAQETLQRVMLTGTRAQERSFAANLLGVLVVTTPAPGTDRSGLAALLRRGEGYFQRAIALDPANGDAKQNLELALRLRKPGKGRIGHDARAGYGFGRGRGATVIGSGY